MNLRCQLDFLSQKQDFNLPNITAQVGPLYDQETSSEQDVLSSRIVHTTQLDECGTSHHKFE